ncbi:MAG: T9SS type A sorting domain-containing protein [Flavobacteriales bacterium]
MFRNLLIVFLLSFIKLQAQLPYSETQFSYDSLLNVPYGMAQNHNGQNVPLLLDIYKPINDANCRRPAVILVHGGAWIAGSKQDPGILYLAREFARRGWVAAAINYRLGMHNTSNYNMYALCNNQISAPCAYISDSSEVFRAIFRAMQDTKGAIRFMKARNELDSTDVNNFFVVGESAGGFAALATAFMISEEQKPIQCSEISDAVVPSPNLAPFGCIPTNLNRSRPDLGSVNGSLHSNAGFDASVQGVGNFFGGLMSLDLLNIPNPKPVLYGYHQGSDVVVHWRYGRLLGRISWECYAPLNICQPYFNMPYAHGNDAIRSYVEQMENAPQYHFDIVNNYNNMNDCGANGHSINNRPQRLQNMIDLFCSRVAANGNIPPVSCSPTSVNQGLESPTLTIYPNPANEWMKVKLLNSDQKSVRVRIISIQGKELQAFEMNSHEALVDISGLPDGLHLIVSDELRIRRLFNKQRQ